jgi:hypothetical protein
MTDKSEQQRADGLRTGMPGEFLVPGNRQLEEIVSWRFVTEFWRRFPDRFDLIEAHPGGGQYDCLALLTKGQNPAIAIDVNRGGGSVHIHKDALGLDGDMSVHSDWMERMLGPEPDKFLDEIAHEARLTVPKKLPASTAATLTYRYISDSLAHSIGRFEKWECRNGFADTSGYGGGVRHQFFEQFSVFADENTIRRGSPIFGEHAYNFWFLMKNEQPVLCLDTGGRVFRRDGTRHELPRLYKRNRRIWPLICETALDILP